MRTAERSLATGSHLEVVEHSTVSSEEDLLSVRTALYFYSIIVFSFVLPVMVAVGLVFTIMALKIILSILSVSLLGGLWYAYRRISAQLRGLQRDIEPLSTEESAYQISLPGRVIEVNVEPKKAQPQHVQAASAESREEKQPSTAPEPPSES